MPKNEEASGLDNSFEIEPTQNSIDVELIEIETLMCFLNFAHLVTEKREVE